MADTFRSLVAYLASGDTECEWIERKCNNSNPDDVGEYLSALANSAALCGSLSGYLIWGVEDGTGNIVGTTFDPKKRKKGNEDLEHWLVRSTNPRVDLRVHQGDVDGVRVVIFEVPAATHTPVSFSGNEYIRIGSYKKRLKDYPEKERRLWDVFRGLTFEKNVAAADETAQGVLAKLDYVSFFDLLRVPLPSAAPAIIERLQADKMIASAEDGRLNITNLGAVLFAKDLKHFERLEHKALRIVVYKGKNKTETVREHRGTRGYANGFADAIAWIDNVLPTNEQIRDALRVESKLYPAIAIRELVANALIHQDFSLTGTGPMVEIYSDRIEVTNPGAPLIDTQRFIDSPPISRNERLASFMRRINICEERGSGVDRVVEGAELFQLPAPDFRQLQHHTQAVLFAPMRYAQMTKEGRVRACYQHAVLQYLSNDQMSNATLRKRFGIDDKNYAMVSRVIGEALDAHVIKPADPDSSSKRHAKYVPFWAA